MIDYAEFLTGERAEAGYVMFKSFLPKLAAIPASAIPISLLGECLSLRFHCLSLPETMTVLIRLALRSHAATRRRDTAPD